MNNYNFEFEEPSQDFREDRPKAVRMYINGVPIDNYVEEEK
jgi:hypothetical protein